MAGGHPLTYNPSNLEEIVTSVHEAGASMGQIADRNGIARQTFRDWMNRGDEDRENGKNTDLAQFSLRIRKEQSIVIKSMFDQVMADTKKTNFLKWWISCVAREDFGLESEDIKELRNLFFTVLMPKMGINKDIDHGKGKIHTESDQTPGCIA